MLDILPLIIFFLFGTFIGSFLNVLILRHNTGKTLLGRSGCMSCRHSLSWVELVPVLSWVFQRGRCRSCASRVSAQYPLVELGTGVLFALAFIVSATPITFVFNAFVFSILLIIFIYDLKHKIIPDQYVWIFFALGALTIFVDFDSLQFASPSIFEVLAPLIVALPFALLWFLSRGAWIGFGDVKLALGIGAFLGITSGFIALIYAFWIGAAVSLGIIFIQKLLTLNSKRKQLTIKSEVPFAPFLIAGFLFVYLFPEVFLAPFRYLYF